jgi:PST family polysaccharide transporter
MVTPTTTMNQSSVVINEPGRDKLYGEQIGRLAQVGSFWSMLATVSQRFVIIAITPILSRLLSSPDYGLIAMVATLTAFLQVFADMGLSWAALQRRELSLGQINNLFWINTAAGTTLAILCAIAAPLVAMFYGRPELTAITLVLGLSYVLSGLTAQPNAMLVRQMKFKAIAIIETCAALSGGLAAVGVAFEHGGYWALVAQVLVAQATRLCLIFAVTKFVPGRPQRSVGTIDMLKFGGFLTARDVVVYFARNLDNVLIGRLWGAQELGYYSRAYFMMSWPMNLTTVSMNRVIISSLSLLQDDLERAGRAYRQAVRLVGFLSFPMAMGLAVAAPEVVRLFFGQTWSPVVPMLFWLSITSVFQPLYGTQSWLFVSSGQGRAAFLQSTGISAVLVCGFIVGVHWGGVGVSAVYAILMTFVITIPSLYFAHRSVGLALAPTLKPLIPMLLAASLMAAAAYVTGRIIESVGLSWLWVLAGKAVAGIVVYIIAGMVLIRPLPIDVLEKWRARLGHRA